MLVVLKAMVTAIATVMATDTTMAMVMAMVMKMKLLQKNLKGLNCLDGLKDKEQYLFNIKRDKQFNTLLIPF